MYMCIIKLILFILIVVILYKLVIINEDLNKAIEPFNPLETTIKNKPMLTSFAPKAYVGRNLWGSSYLMPSLYKDTDNTYKYGNINFGNLPDYFEKTKDTKEQIDLENQDTIVTKNKIKANMLQAIQKTFEDTEVNMTIDNIDIKKENDVISSITSEFKLDNLYCDKLTKDEKIAFKKNISSLLDYNIEIKLCNETI
jgi:hypothetical protein